MIEAILVLSILNVGLQCVAIYQRHQALEEVRKNEDG